MGRVDVASRASLDQQAVDDAATATSAPKQTDLRLAECVRRARQAIYDGRKARYERDLVAFQTALDEFMDAFSDWECARDEASPGVLDVAPGTAQPGKLPRSSAGVGSDKTPL